MSIREATHADLDVLVALGEEFHDSTEYANELAGNPAQYRVIGTRLIEQPDGVLLVYEQGGRPVGMLGAVLFNHPLSGERTVAEMFWYATPKHRGDAGIRLLRALERWARTHGAGYIQMVQPIWADRIGELYGVLGYRKLEVAWTRHL